MSTLSPATLTKALLRATDLLGLRDELCAILGSDEHRVAAMLARAAQLEHGSREWDIATQCVGLFRSLISLLGDAENARTWLDASNSSLGASPRQLMLTDAGRQRLLRYLDAVGKYELKLPPRGERH